MDGHRAIISPVLLMLLSWDQYWIHVLELWEAVATLSPECSAFPAEFLLNTATQGKANGSHLSVVLRVAAVLSRDPAMFIGSYSSHLR